MSDWKLHAADEDNLFSQYKCGLVAGQRVMLRRELVCRDHTGEPSGEIHPAGEIWTVLPGLISDPVLWLRQPDGARHTWDDDVAQVAEWFQVVESEGA
ncbi:hypothetical protein [Roseimaritima sediminicola]|uniref:hypothetical protein n=1 Tax=Roseimaritima sediminicola TaxID=2662066 RepID=UPI0012985565|nr:hypothetical protein [Roseimaritima sediminicola]